MPSPWVFASLACFLAFLAAGCGSPQAAGLPAQVAAIPKSQPLVATPASKQLPGLTSGKSTATSAPAEIPLANWPQWLGPRGDGVSPEKGWRTDWPKAGLPKLWQAEVGTGYSSIAVAQNLAITGGHRDGQDTWFAFDAATGEPRWKHSYRCARVDNLHEGGTGATPAIYGDAVYLVSREGEVFCLAAKDGAVRWSKRLANQVEVKMPEWGFTSSPRIAGDRLYLDLGCVVCVDRASGEILWKSEKFSPGYGSPTLFERKGRKLVAVLNNKGLLIVSAEKGEQVAFSEWVTDYATNATTPLISGDTIFLSTGYNRGCTLLRWTADNDLEAVYENKNLANHMNNSILWEGHLYGIHGNSHSSGQCRLTCLDLATGEVRWSERGFGCGSLLVADGQLLVLSDKGELVLAEASPEAYREKGRMKILEGVCWTMPSLAGQKLYARDTPGHVVCMDLRQPN